MVSYATLITIWQDAAMWLGEHGVAPVLNWLKLTPYTKAPETIAAALMIGLLQLLVICLLFRPLEALCPAEEWADRRQARIDFHYSWLMLISLFPLFTFLVLSPLGHFLGGGADEGTGAIWQLSALWPWLAEHGWLLFALYYLCYDFVYYWLHRVQHIVPWWWALHAVHHSQRQLNCWSNDRTHYLDGVLQSFILASVGLFFGLSIETFAWFMFVGELLQCFSHANVRIGFGPILNKILVDPKFHRLHHMVFVPERPHLHHCNFGQVFAFWDIVFKTALYDEPPHPTGVDDPRVDSDNQFGVVGIQVQEFKRFWGCFKQRKGWRLGEVVFNKRYDPIHMDTKPVQPHGTDEEEQAR